MKLSNNPVYHNVTTINNSVTDHKIVNPYQNVSNTTDSTKPANATKLTTSLQNVVFSAIPTRPTTVTTRGISKMQNLPSTPVLLQHRTSTSHRSKLCLETKSIPQQYICRLFPLNGSCAKRISNFTCEAGRHNERLL